MSRFALLKKKENTFIFGTVRFALFIKTKNAVRFGTDSMNMVQNSDPLMNKKIVVVDLRFRLNMSKRINAFF